MADDPTRPLKNPHHEVFAQEIAKGRTNREAYLTAGYKPKDMNVTDAAAARLLADVRVSARVAALQIKGAEIAGVEIAITQKRVLEELAKLALSNMLDYVQVGDDGDAFVNLKNLTREQAAAIQEITVEDFKDGRGEDARDVRRVRFKLADKRAALVDIGKHFGMFVDRTEIGRPGDFSNHDDDALRRIISAEARELGVSVPRIAPPRGSNGASGKPH